MNKALADAGLCSRRKADELVFAGKITVNGRVAESPGERVVPGKDAVTCEGRAVALRGDGQETVATCVIMLNKPVEVVSTVRDPEGRKTVLDFVPSAFKKRRLYPVGRLDYFSEGLILLTDDGELANRLMHPRWHLPRVYEVRVRPDRSREVPEAALAAMRRGMTLKEGEKLAPVEVSVVEGPGHGPGQGVLLKMTLHQGLNRQIRRMCRDLGLTILKLKRLSQGPLSLGDLAPGKVRVLNPKEMSQLRKAVGLEPVLARRSS